MNKNERESWGQFVKGISEKGGKFIEESKKFAYVIQAIHI